MKTTKLFILLAAAGLAAAACEKPETEIQPVAVESVTLDESIAEGYAMKTGETFNIAELVTVLPENATDKSIVWSTHNEWFDISPDGVLKMNNPEKFKYNSTGGYVFVSTAANSLMDTIYVKMSMMSISFEDVTIARGQSCDLQYLVNYDHDYEIEFEQLEGFEFFKLSGSVITTFNQHEFLAGRVVVRYKDYPTVDDYVWVTVD